MDQCLWTDSIAAIAGGVNFDTGGAGFATAAGAGAGASRFSSRGFTWRAFSKASCNNVWTVLSSGLSAKTL